MLNNNIKIMEEKTEVANELKQLRAENESLKNQVKELENMKNYWYNEWHKQVEKHDEQVKVLQYVITTMKEK